MKEADVIVRVVWAASDKSADLAGVFQECLTFDSSVAAFAEVCCIDQWDRYTAAGLQSGLLFMQIETKTFADFGLCCFLDRWWALCGCVRLC